MEPGEGPCPYVTAIKDPNLTTEQTTKIRDLRVAHLRDIKPLQDEMFSKRGDLKLFWLEKNPDPAKIAAKRKEIRSLRNQIEDNCDAHRLQVFNILTPEQREKAQLLWQHFRSGMHHMKRGHVPGMGMHDNW